MESRTTLSSSSDPRLEAREYHHLILKYLQDYLDAQVLSRTGVGYFDIQPVEKLVVIGLFQDFLMYEKLRADSDQNNNLGAHSGDRRSKKRKNT